MKFFSALVLASLLPVCAEAAPVFVYCSEGSPSSFNPQIATDGPTFNATGPVYNQLVEFKYGETTVVPALAESWSISKDGMSYTFKLRKGVKFGKTAYFTPKRDFNADDVLFSFDRQRVKSHPFHMIGGGTYEYFDSMDMGNTIKEIKKIDDYTVQFNLTHTEAPFLANLAMDFSSILSKEYGDQLLATKQLAKMDMEPVGTGSYTFQSYAKDSMIRYNMNPDFWGTKAKVQKLVFSITPDASVRFQKLKTGECHLVAEPAPNDLPAIKGNAKLRVMERAGLNVGYLSFNTLKKPFDNQLVRQAINYAVNRKAYVDALYLGNAVVAKNPIPPTMWSYNDKVKDYEYSPEKAKELLKKAGFANGFSTELWTLPVSRPYNPNGKKMGEMMQADLAKVGIQVKLVSYDWPTYLAKAKNGEHQMIQLGWTGDNGDPDNFLNVLLSCNAVKTGSNNAMWCNKDFDKLVMDAKNNTDMKKRTSMYEKAQLLFKEQAPWATIAHAKAFRAMVAGVSGYKIEPFGGDSFNEIDVK